jgi:hypothetical protein
VTIREHLAQQAKLARWIMVAGLILVFVLTLTLIRLGVPRSIRGFWGRSTAADGQRQLSLSEARAVPTLP